MNFVPPEIWQKIFSDACLDSGFTGRSLSLVSKYIYEMSKPTRFQSLAIRNYEQVMAFADILERTPSHLRRVIHLFISTQDPEPKKSSSQYIPATSIGFPGLYSRIQEENEQSMEEMKKISSAIRRILLCIAPSIQILAMFTYGWNSVLLPLSCPNLTEFIISGSYDESMSPTNEPLIMFGSLRYLHTGGCLGFDTGHLQYISDAAPSLTHLRFTAIDMEDLDAFAPTVTNILIQAPSPPRRIRCGTHYRRFLDRIQHLHNQILEQKDDRFKLLQAPVPSQGQGKGEAVFRQWLERINGGQGCWIITNSDGSYR